MWSGTWCKVLCHIGCVIPRVGAGHAIELRTQPKIDLAQVAVFSFFLWRR